MRGWRAAVAGIVVGSAVLTACGAGGEPAAPTSAAQQIQIGAGGTAEDVAFVASERVGGDRITRARLEEAGEIRIDAIARRVTAYRLKDSPRAALRYTADGEKGWLAWTPRVVFHARQALSKDQNAAVSAIQTLDVTNETWTDDCLNLPRTRGSCATASIPGFRVVLRLGGRTYAYHTDTTDRTVAEPQQ